jgi:anti-sigma factor RsiW
MNSHLNHEQITDALLDFADGDSRQHLAECSECQAKVKASEEILAGFGEAARSEGARDESFWSRQRLVIAARIEQGARRRTLRLVWGAAAATAAALVLWVALGRAPSGPTQPLQVHDPAIAKQYENDDVLLRHVELALERPAPAALAPAEVLTSELGRSKPARRKPVPRSTKQ